MNATKKTTLVLESLKSRGIDVTFYAAEVLRRSERTLRRWGELCCGDSDNSKSWAIERDETTGKPFMCYYFHDGRNEKTAIPDRESGALKRAATVCSDCGLYFFHQTDPRGCQLYVHTEPINDSNYTNGVGCCP